MSIVRFIIFLAFGFFSHGHIAFCQEGEHPENGSVDQNQEFQTLGYHELVGPVKEVKQSVFEYRRKKWWSLRRKELPVKNANIAPDFLYRFNEAGYLTYGVQEYHDKSIKTFFNIPEVDTMYYEYTSKQKVKVIRTIRGYAVSFDSIFYNAIDQPIRQLNYGYDGRLINEKHYTYDKQDRLDFVEHFFSGTLFQTESISYNDSTYSVEGKQYFISGGFAQEKRVHSLQGELIEQKINYPNGPSSAVHIKRNMDGQIKSYEALEWNPEGVLIKKQRKEYHYDANEKLARLELFEGNPSRDAHYLTTEWVYAYDTRNQQLLSATGRWYTKSGEVYRKEEENRFYDEKGNCITLERNNQNNGETTKTNTLFIQYDDYNNWVTKTIYMEGKEKYGIKRKILYYN